MKLYSEPKLIVRLACIFMIFPVNPNCAKELIFNTTWVDNSGEHKLVMETEVNKDNTGEHLSVKQVTKGKDDWILNDYVNDCEVDVNLNLIKESIEVNNSFADGTVLFACKIGCIGGVDPVAVKYFAYKNGVKYSLRGGEHIIVENGRYGGESPPVPDYNLKKR